MVHSQSECMMESVSTEEKFQKPLSLIPFLMSVC